MVEAKLTESKRLATRFLEWVAMIATIFELPLVLVALTKVETMRFRFVKTRDRPIQSGAIEREAGIIENEL